MSLLEQLGLSPEAIAARVSCIGGSDANTIMSGRPDRLIKLWREKRAEAAGDDLSEVLAVQMGSFTEPLNVAWFEKQTGFKVNERGRVRGSDTTRAPHAWMNCTLDGMVDDGLADDAVFEAKHTGTRSTDAEIFERYVPQLTHNCLCAGVTRAYLSAFKGNGDWLMWEYDLDVGYAAALVEAELAFWNCVRTGEPPAPLPLPPAPKPKGVVEYDLTTSNAWASHAADYRETMLAADRHDIAKKGLKELVPADASKAFGHGITIKRDARGALRITSQEA